MTGALDKAYIIEYSHAVGVISCMRDVSMMISAKTCA